jgi:phosphoesterase RecJ-like protein
MNIEGDAKKLAELLENSKEILIMQADNPDGDSLGSSLALEQILGDLGKDTYMYCAVDMPSYLRYMDGWDRVQKEIPSQFDLSIMVDVSTDTLFELLEKSPQKSWVSSKPCIVIDHHDIESKIPYASLVINHPVVATSELIYELAQKLSWPINIEAKKMIMIAIMSDSLGLTTEATTARSIQIVSELVAGGVNIAEIEMKRRDLSRKSPSLVHYKGELLERVEYYFDNRIAVISIPWEEIVKYSNEYNPSMLVLDDMRQTINTRVGVAFKIYNDGKVTGKIRCNYGSAVANTIAEHFGGGGHKYASGFKITDRRPFEDIKKEFIEITTKLLKEMGNKNEDI